MPKVGTPQVYEDPMEPWRPRVITEIPGPKSKELIKNLDKYQVSHFCFILKGLLGTISYRL